MNDKLNIALLQSSLVWEDPETNRRQFSKKLNLVSNDTDLAILPEMFTSGFTMSPENLGKGESEKTVDWMVNEAINRNMALVGSVVFYENDKYYNRLLFVKPNGEVSSYNKRHTFTLAGEHKKYTSGKSIEIIEYKGFKINPLICYDLRFPVWSRNTDDYDILVYVANWPKPRITAWDALLKARAIENMAYCVGVNRIGKDEKGLEYDGHSAVYDPLGEKQAFSDKEEIIETTISKAYVDEVRSKLRFLEDRDDFNLKY
ncbi:amidohydrolase [Maribacter sp. MMG018]|uniref:amidohydrolase n=1 Tax=Maribacter sp. MMG018 TaxID=2822688 RepID=UPI001B38ADBE|nr:amidohydrolase [Maribacter sp. MMG018]MBQ4913136.1 amidohydrolase [Maribacter sp. MMG018]